MKLYPEWRSDVWHPEGVIVQHEGRLWVAVRASNIVAPSPENDAWRLLAHRLPGQKPRRGL